jgi:hypothetical protein
MKFTQKRRLRAKDPQPDRLNADGGVFDLDSWEYESPPALSSATASNRGGLAKSRRGSRRTAGLGNGMTGMAREADRRSGWRGLYQRSQLVSRFHIFIQVEKRPAGRQRGKQINANREIAAALMLDECRCGWCTRRGLPQRFQQSFQ